MVLLHDCSQGERAAQFKVPHEKDQWNMGQQSKAEESEPTPVKTRDTPADPAKKKCGAQLEEKRIDESGGPSGPEPTRYGDWERKGIARDF